MCDGRMCCNMRAADLHGNCVRHARDLTWRATEDANLLCKPNCPNPVRPGNSDVIEVSQFLLAHPPANQNPNVTMTRSNRSPQQQEEQEHQHKCNCSRRSKEEEMVIIAVLSRAARAARATASLLFC